MKKFNISIAGKCAFGALAISFAYENDSYSVRQTPANSPGAIFISSTSVAFGSPTIEDRTAMSPVRSTEVSSLSM